MRLALSALALSLGFALCADAAADERDGANSTDSAFSEPVRGDRDRPRRKSARERAAARRAERQDAERERNAKEHRAWLARLKARNVEPWPDESEKDHAEGLSRSRAMIDEVVAALPGMQLYETEHFLFTSNIPAAQVGPYIASLDRMYEWMCQLYGIPADQKVWLGAKVPVFAFLEQSQFAEFEQKYFELNPVGIYGLCHQSPRGDVIISCFRGDNPRDFAQMLVHETSHGFNHRYKTKQPLPNWVDEGMADLIGAQMVPASQMVKNREMRALAQMSQQRSLGGNFFSAKAIESWQYGAASSLNRFLLQADRKAYVRFIENLKEGMPWPEALERAYGTSPDEMLLHYGQWVGVEGLRP